VNQIVTIIGPTVFVILLGYIFRRLSKVDLAAVADVAVLVATPCLAFHSMYTSEIVLREAGKLWLSLFFVMAGTALLARAVFAVLRQRHSGLYLAISFANMINIPLPIIYLAFGDEGAARVILMSVPQAILMYSLGVYVASNQGSIRQGLGTMLRTPLIYAAVLGLVFNLTRVPLPEVVILSTRFMGQASVPLMLFLLGSTIGRFRVTQGWLTAGAAVMRMGVGFSLGLLIAWLLGLQGISRAVVIFESAMPAAVMGSVLCIKYGNQEKELVASVVLVTTLAAVGVVPALLYYLT
jgi:predicted permease